MTPGKDLPWLTPNEASKAFCSALNPSVPFILDELHKLSCGGQRPTKASCIALFPHMLRDEGEQRVHAGPLRIIAALSVFRTTD